MLTKKAKLEQFDALKRRHDLLERYFWDQADAGAQLRPDASVRLRAEGEWITFRLYGSLKSHGGYLVIASDMGNTYIYYFDDWSAEVRKMGYSCGEWERVNVDAHERLNRVRFALFEKERNGGSTADSQYAAQ